MEAKTDLAQEAETNILLFIKMNLHNEKYLPPFCWPGLIGSHNCTCTEEYSKTFQPSIFNLQLSIFNLNKLLPDPQPELPWCDAIFPEENPVEITDVLKARLVSHRLYALICFQ